MKQIIAMILCCVAMLGGVGVTKEAGQTYVVGSGATYRPFEFETSNKELQGFDIDLIKAIAQAENFNIKLVNTPWEAFSPL